jgi:hypothetical protein
MPETSRPDMTPTGWEGIAQEDWGAQLHGSCKHLKRNFKLYFLSYFRLSLLARLQEN